MLGLLLLAATFAFPMPGRGAVTCEFSEEVASLRNPADSASYSEEVRRELRIREELLSRILDCSIDEARETEERLAAIIPPTHGAVAKSDLQSEFADVLRFYETEKEKIGVLGLQGTKDFSKNLLDWRKARYSPFAEKIENFSTWSDNQKVFSLAENRMRQVGQTVRVLRPVDNIDVDTLFGQAEQSFRDADGKNRDITRLFRKENSPDDSLNAMKSSLESLSATYEHLFRLSELVQEILPH